MPARRKRLDIPKGLKPVRARLATGEVRVYWYHRATGKRLKHDPASAEGLLEVARLDGKGAGLKAAQEASQRTYAAVWTAYRESEAWRALKPRTRADYQAVRDWLGRDAERPLATLTTAGVYKLRDKAEATKGRRFANYVVQVLSLTLNWGRRRDLCDANPAADCETIAKPRGERKVNRAWSRDEVAAFVDGAPAQLLVPFALGLFAGMREGDALAVTWSAYDGRTIQWIAGKNGEECEAPTAGAFKAVLDQAKAARGRAVQIAFNSRREPWTEDGFRASFFRRVRELRAAGKVRPGLTFHGLRHTIARSAREAGESESRIAAAIGDRSPAMAAVYGRDADRNAAQTAVLDDVQKRLGNIDWKTDWKTPASPAAPERRKP